MTGLKDEDSITYEFFIEENATCFTLIVSAPSSMDTVDIHDCLVTFARDLRDGKVSLTEPGDEGLH